VLGDAEQYRPKLPVEFVKMPAGNEALISDIRDDPARFSYDGEGFDDGTPRAINRKAVDAKSQLNTADFDAAKKSIEAASTVNDLKITLAEVVELVARLVEAQGLEPKSPTAEGVNNGK